MTTPTPDAATRQLLRTLIVTMNDVEALKILFLNSFPFGYVAAEEKLVLALDAASHKTKPFLDALDRADDQELLDLLATWKGGLTY
jgi:hypothetical protein